MSDELDDLATSRQDPEEELPDGLKFLGVAHGGSWPEGRTGPGPSDPDHDPTAYNEDWWVAKAGPLGDNRRAEGRGLTEAAAMADLTRVLATRPPSS